MNLSFNKPELEGVVFACARFLRNRQEAKPLESVLEECGRIYGVLRGAGGWCCARDERAEALVEEGLKNAVKAAPHVSGSPTSIDVTVSRYGEEIYLTKISFGNITNYSKKEVES